MKKIIFVLFALAYVFAINAQSAVDIIVTKHGVKANGVTDNTKAINKLIDKAPDGAKIVFPEGKYLTGTIKLKSNITLFLAEGAEIVAVQDLAKYESYRPAKDMSKYDSGEGTRNSNLASDPIWTRALILGDKVENVTIAGAGKVNGMHVLDPQGEEGMRGPHGILFAESENIKVQDITITCASNYAVMGYELKNSVISGLTISEGWDGVHIRGCENVKITGCDIKTGDDAIAGGYWKNMTIEHCKLNSSCNGIRMIMPSENLEIGHCEIYGPGVYAHRTSGDQKRTGTIYGIVLEPGGWGDAPGHTEGVYIHDVTMDNMLSAIVYSMGENNTCSGLTIENVTATRISYNTTPLNRQDCPRMWDNITIKSMTVKQGK